MTDTILGHSPDFSNTLPTDYPVFSPGLAPVLPGDGGTFEPINTGVAQQIVIVTKRDGKPARYAGLKALRKHTPDWLIFNQNRAKNRAKYCLATVLGAGAEIRELVRDGKPAGSHVLGSLRPCKSVHTCPTCSRWIRGQRSAVLQAGMNRHLAAGGSILMLTVTLPHQRQDSLMWLLDSLAAIWNSFFKSREVRDIMRGLGLVAYVKNLEVTFGDAHGWHPHNHVLLFVRSGVSPDDVARALFPSWENYVRKRISRRANPETGLTVIGGESAADYLLKSGISPDKDLAKEITHVHMKATKRGRLSQWGILEGLGAGELDLLPVWCEYAVAIHGRPLLWGLGDLLKLYQVSEEEQAAIVERLQELNESILKDICDPELWGRIYKANLLDDLLALYDSGRGNLQGVLDLLEKQP